jgi:hypothetical protein
MRSIRAALAALGLAGCGASTRPTVDAGLTSDGGAACTWSRGQGTPYDLARSRFAFGSTPTLTTGDLTRWTGANGVVAIAPLGSELASLHGGAAVASLPDWSQDPAALSAHVRGYFIAMGVDACQVRSTGVLGGGEGSIVEVHRAVEGIPVTDSLAYARFDSEDQSTAEAFWWPTIPADVVDAARALRDRLADPAALAAYRALLPANAQGDGQVVIRHTPSSSTSATLRAQAVWRVVGAQRGEGGSFDASGAAVTGDG